jgi:hypothetical protein
MFDLSLMDHLRLTFGYVVYRQKAHADLARSRATWSRASKGAQAVLLLAVAITSVAVASASGAALAIVTAVCGGLALAVLLVQLTFDDDAVTRAHSVCAARLWDIREQYRAILADLADGAIDPATARQRRDVLIAELHDVLRHAPPAGAHAYDATAIEERALTDEQIDLFLPKSLHKVDRPAESRA